MTLGPLIFTAKRVPKIWGSEAWHIYDRPGDSAVVAQGPFQGQALQALMQEYGPGLLGQAAFEKEPALFPLAFKIIEAQDALSLQVHPSDDQAARLAGPGESAETGKSEMWLLLKAEPGARLTAGLKAGTTRGQFLKALKSGGLEGLLNTFSAKAGEAVAIPAGCLHSMGKGCLVAELQQNSDITLRVHDFGRLENGKPRELQVDQALECIDFAALPADPARPAPASVPEELLAESPHFKASRLKLEGAFRAPAGPASFHILHGLEGSAVLESAEGPLPLAAGTTVLLPASLDWSLKPRDGAASLMWGRP